MQFYALPTLESKQHDFFLPQQLSLKPSDAAGNSFKVVVLVKTSLLVSMIHTNKAKIEQKQMKKGVWL